MRFRRFPPLAADAEARRRQRVASVAVVAAGAAVVRP
jgi:hypothetical protein